MLDCMDVFPSNEDNVVPVPWLYVHNLHTRRPEIRQYFKLQHSMQVVYYFTSNFIIRNNSFYFYHENYNLFVCDKYILWLITLYVVCTSFCVLFQ